LYSSFSINFSLHESLPSSSLLSFQSLLSCLLLIEFSLHFILFSLNSSLLSFL
jgi:hypothetical protein